jgi:hypothetical protein
VLGHLLREGQLVQGAPDPLLVRFLFHEAPLCHRLPVPEDGVPTQGKNYTPLHYVVERVIA